MYHAEIHTHTHTLRPPYWGQCLTDRSVIKMLGDQSHLLVGGGGAGKHLTPSHVTTPELGPTPARLQTVLFPSRGVTLPRTGMFTPPPGKSRLAERACCYCGKASGVKHVRPPSEGVWVRRDSLLCFGMKTEAFGNPPVFQAWRSEAAVRPGVRSGLGGCDRWTSGHIPAVDVTQRRGLWARAPVCAMPCVFLKPGTQPPLPTSTGHR